MLKDRKLNINLFSDIWYALKLFVSKKFLIMLLVFCWSSYFAQVFSQVSRKKFSLKFRSFSKIFFLMHTKILILRTISTILKSVDDYLESFESFKILLVDRHSKNRFEKKVLIYTQVCHTYIPLYHIVLRTYIHL